MIGIGTNTEPPDTIVFDVGGVLIDWNPRRLYRKIFQGRESEMECFLSSVCSAAWNAELDAGKPFSEGVRELQEQWPEYSQAIAAYDHRWAEMLGEPFSEAVLMLSRLKCQGYRVFALTNFSVEKFAIARQRYPFLELFDGVLISGEEGLIKPDSQIYRLLLLRYGLVAGRTAFLDDKMENVQAACREGMLGIHYVAGSNKHSLAEKLRTRGISVSD